MNIYFTVREMITGVVIPSATVELLDAAGNSKGIKGYTNSAGTFGADLLLTDKVRITHVGYLPATYPVAQFGGGGDVVLTKQTDNLAEVVVTPRNNYNWLLWAAGAYAAGKILKLF